MRRGRGTVLCCQKKEGVAIATPPLYGNGRRDGRLRGFPARCPAPPAPPTSRGRSGNLHPTSDRGQSFGSGDCKTASRAIPPGLPRPSADCRLGSVRSSSETQVEDFYVFFPGLADSPAVRLAALPPVSVLSDLPDFS